MEMPKPVGCVLIALRSFPDRWHVPSFEMAAHITLYASLFGTILRCIRAQRSTEMVVVSPHPKETSPDDDLNFVQVRLLSDVPIPLPEYAGDRIGCADHPLRVERRFFCFQLGFFVEDDLTGPVVSARLFLDPDETRMDTFVPSDCGTLYRADKYRRYIDENIRELGALVRAHTDRENEELLRDLNARAAALLARLEDVALPEDKPNPRKPNPKSN